jgi:hypothetical protein
MLNKAMSLEEFEVEYQAAIDDVLNQMQTLVLLLACAETKTVEIGDSLQSIRQMTASFLTEQRKQSIIDTVCPSLNETMGLRETERELQQVLPRS